MKERCLFNRDIILINILTRMTSKTRFEIYDSNQRLVSCSVYDQTLLYWEQLFFKFLRWKFLTRFTSHTFFFSISLFVQFKISTLVLWAQRKCCPTHVSRVKGLRVGRYRRLFCSPGAPNLCVLRDERWVVPRVRVSPQRKVPLSVLEPFGRLVRSY